MVLRYLMIMSFFQLQGLLSGCWQHKGLSYRSAETVSGRENIFLLYYFGFDWELFFFQTACMVLCFMIVTKTGLITHQCFSCCLAMFVQNQGHLCFSLCSPSLASRLRVSKRLGGSTALGCSLKLTKGNSMPYNIMLSNKIGEWLGIDLLVGGGKCLLLHHLAFGFVFFCSPSYIKLYYLSPWKVFSLLPLSFSPILLASVGTYFPARINSYACICV